MTKKNDFYDKVFEVVAQIPYGKVTTYGAIANYLGSGGSSRLVGYALNSSIKQPYVNLPCHRVVNRLGQLTGKVHFGADVMETLLRHEGIEFTAEDTINIEKHFWNPIELENHV